MTDAAMPSQRRRARLVLILIAGIPLSMMLGAVSYTHLTLPTKA